MVQYRDPTELRLRYKAKKAVLEKYMAALNKIIAGDPLPRAQLPELLTELNDAHKKFTEESQHFVHWMPR